MALWPISDFDPKRISKIYDTLCNYEMSCFYQKITLFVILLQFQAILLPYKPVCY